jgi:hypothetical protein
MKRIFATAIGIAVLATTAMAGDWRNDNYPNGNGAYYGRQPNGSYGYFAPTPYGYINGGNGYAPPPKPPVMVEPFACERSEMVFIPRFNRYICKPVAVPRY